MNSHLDSFRYDATVRKFLVATQAKEYAELERPIDIAIAVVWAIHAGVQDAFMQWWYGHNAVAFARC